MFQCPKCNDYRFGAECNCKKFHVINEDGDTYDVQAMDEEEAALKYAAESNEDGDYYLMNDSVEISVDGKPFRISAEPDVHYYATDLTENEDE